MIAEIGVNHGGDLTRAKNLIRLAREGGADAAKLQTYKAHRLAVRDSPAYWDLNSEPTRSQYELFRKYDGFGPDEYRELAEFSSELQIDFISTPFDDQAVEWLDPLVPFFKIASADLTSNPLLEKVAATGKPVVLSTGASSLDEIDAALAVLNAAGCDQVALLHCVLNYPTARREGHLAMIRGLLERYPEHVIGYSDHIPPDQTMSVLTTAYLLGARILEKHFTDDKSLVGNDHYHAMDSADLSTFSTEIDRLDELIGPTSTKRPLDCEQPAIEHARRSIVLTVDVPAGAALTTRHLTYKRPARGISPIHWHDVLGRRTSRPLLEDHCLQWSDLAE